MADPVERDLDEAPKIPTSPPKPKRPPCAPLLGRPTTTDSVDGRMAVVQRYVFRTGCVLMVLAALFTVAAAWGNLSFVRVFAVCGATILAAACVGGLTGFLFGIPRLLQRMEGGHAGEGSATEATRLSFVDLRHGRSRSVSGNSNLEEVSDWLTKIIVGLTLVHLGDIKTNLLTLAMKLSAATGATKDDPTFSGFFLCLILAGFVLGFLSIYLEARTRVAALISDTELMLDGDGLDAEAIKISYNAGVLGPSLGGNPMLVRPARPTPQDAQLVAFPYSSLSTAQDYAAWGAAQARTGNYLAAVRAMTDAIAQEPGNESYLRLLADVRRLQRMPRAEFDVLQEMVNRGGADDDLMRRLLLVALYTSPPDGFRFVIEQVTARDFPLANDPDVLLYYASALGQEVKWLRNNPGTRTPQEVEEAVAAIRAKALNTLTQIEASSPDRTKGARRIARLLFDPGRPGGSPSENDLEVFKGDKEFEDLLTP